MRCRGVYQDAGNGRYAAYMRGLCRGLLHARFVPKLVLQLRRTCNSRFFDWSTHCLLLVRALANVDHMCTSSAVCSQHARWQDVLWSRLWRHSFQGAMPDRVWPPAASGENIYSSACEFSGAKQMPMMQLCLRQTIIWRSFCTAVRPCAQTMYASTHKGGCVSRLVLRFQSFLWTLCQSDLISFLIHILWIIVSFFDNVLINNLLLQILPGDG